MRFGGHFPYLKDHEIRAFRLNFGGGDSSDSDGDSGGGGLVGGRGSNVAERPRTTAERAFSTVGSKLGGALVSGITGSPIAGAAASRGISALTSGPVTVDLRRL